MGASTSSWDPFLGCKDHSENSAADRDDEEGSTQVAVVPRRLEALNSAGRGVGATRPMNDDERAEDAMMQEALRRSYEEHLLGGDAASAAREAEKRELEEALLQSELQWAGCGSGPPPEARSESVLKLEALLAELGMERMDVGSTNLNEGGDLLNNQCFYLSIARSWLAGATTSGGFLVRDSALLLKREIEASVVSVRGDGGRRNVGEESEAYADFLACALCSEAVGGGSAVADLAIAVFASLCGTVEAYEGGSYARQPRDQRVANLACVWHRNGHFEAVVAAGSHGKANLTLDELLRHAERADVAATVVRA